MSIVIYKNACSQRNMQIYLSIGECSHTSLKEILTSVKLSNSSKLQSCHSPSLTAIKEKYLGYPKK